MSIANDTAFYAMTVHSIVAELLKFLCFQMWTHDPRDVVEEGANQVLEMMRALPPEVCDPESPPATEIAFPVNVEKLSVAAMQFGICCKIQNALAMSI